MIRRLAASVSARSRRRKLDLFLETMRPTAEMTVVDVGVSDGSYGEDMAGTANFFEALYPWPERITAVSTQHTLVPFVHWLSDERRDAAYRRLGRDGGLGLGLLSPGDFLALFAASTRPRLLRRGMTLVAVADTASTPSHEG